MKKTVTMALTLGLALALTACSGWKLELTHTAPSSAAESVSAPSSAPSKNPTSPADPAPSAPSAPPTTPAPSAASAPEQYAFPGDDTAKKLAAQVNRTFIFDGPALADFEGAGNADKAQMLAAALYHTPAINSELGSNDRLDSAIAAAKSAQLSPDYLYYGEEVRRIAKMLFGSKAEPEMADSSVYYYFPDQDIFIRMGDYGGPVAPCAQLISYTQTAKGYTCDVMVAHWIGTNECWIYDANSNQITLTTDNIQELAASQPLSRYTFESEDGQLILTGFKKL